MNQTTPLALSTVAAAELLNLSPRTSERWRLEGRGPSFRKLGSRVVYCMSDLTRWADEQLRKSTSDPGQRR